jgi:hypothetical protein
VSGAVNVVGQETPLDRTLHHGIFCLEGSVGRGT